MSNDIESATWEAAVEAIRLHAETAAAERGDGGVMVNCVCAWELVLPSPDGSEEGTRHYYLDYATNQENTPSSAIGLAHWLTAATKRGGIAP